MRLERKASILFLICFALYLGLSIVIAAVSAKLSEDLQFLLSSIFVSIPAFLVPALLFRRRNALPVFKAPRFGHIMIAAAIGFGCVYMNEALTFFNNILYSGIELNSNTTTAETILELHPLVMILSLAIIPPVCEEFIMRGTLLESWRGTSPIGAAVLTSAMFALLHLAPSGFIIYFGIGMLLAVVYLITRNVWMTVIIHLVNNSASVYSALSTKIIAAQKGVSPYEMLNEAQSGLFEFLPQESMNAVMLIVTSLMAAAIIVPMMLVLKGIYKRNKLGMYEERPLEEPVTDGMLTCDAAEIAEQKRPSLLSDPVLIVTIAILIILNILMGLIEFGVIKI